MKIKAISLVGKDIWCEMRNNLWPEEKERNQLEVEEFFEGESSLTDVMVADLKGQLVGFIEYWKVTLTKGGL